MPSDGDRTERLHPVSLLFGVGTAARNLLFPAALVLVSSSVNRYDSWLALLFVPAVVGYLVKYLSYRYRLGAEEMVIREGLLTRNERHIPYARIQNIDLVQNPLHRLFGVAVVRLETASGGRPEAVIRVLSGSQIEAMRAKVFAGRSETVAAPAEDGVAPVARDPAGKRLLALPIPELVVYGLISNRGLVVVAAVFGLLFQTNWWEGKLWSRYAPRAAKFIWDDHAVTGVGAVAGHGIELALIAVSLIVVFVLLMRVLSVAWAIFRLYGYELRLRGDALGASYGLLTHVTATVPRHRIQLLSTQASWLHRRFRRVSVFVETAGGAGEGESGAAVADRHWLAPVLPAGELHGLVREVLPEVDLDAVEWRPLEARAWRRVFFRGLVAASILCAILAPLIGPWSALLLLLLVPWAAFHARRWIATAGWALTPHAVLFKSGWWGRRMSVVRYGKIQGLTLTQSPFDRRKRMAVVAVDTAGAGRVGHPVRIPFLDVATAQSAAARLYAEAGSIAFRWR